MISPDVVGVRACLDARMRADCARLGLCPANIPRRKHAYVAERAMGTAGPAPVGTAGCFDSSVL